MASEKIIITKKELNGLIMEEAKKFKKALSLKKELASINKQINEVHPGGEMAPGANGVHAGQKKPVFASKGNPNLKMEDGVEDELGGEEGALEMSEIERICMDLGKAIDAKIAAVGGGEVAGAEGDENLEFDANDLGDEADSEGEEEVGAEVPAEGGEEGIEDEVKEAAPATPVAAAAPVAPTEAKSEEECTVAENMEEPMEGKTPAQDAKQDTVNDNMEKSKLVAEGTEVKGTLMEEEKKRMAFLAGIMKG